MGATLAFKPVRHLRVLPLGTLSDERLAELASIGHEDAFATLYERYRIALARYCRSIVRDPQDAADALQNTMVSVLRAIQARRPAGPIRPWLYRIAHNESISIIRRRQPHEELSTETPDRADTVRSLIEADRLEALLADLRSLPERQRGALVMRELGGLEYEDIGNALQTTGVAARKAVFEARVALHDLADARNADCMDIRRRISDGDGRALRGRAIRGHLTACAACTAFQQGLKERQGAFALIPAWPAVSIAALVGGTAAGGTAIGGGSSSSGLAISGTAAGTTALGGGGAAAVKGFGIASAIAVAGAGLVVGTGIVSHARRAHHLEAVVAHSARAPRARHVANAGASRVVRPARAHASVARRAGSATATHEGLGAAPTRSARAAVPAPHRTPTVSSAPNTRAPAASVPTTGTATTSAPKPPAPASPTNAPPSGTPTTPTAPPPAVTTATNLATSIIQTALQTAGTDLAAAEAQAAQTLAAAGAAQSSAQSTVQGLLNAILHPSHP
jgi:RNA polymerase sigma factor (sigma-70 family)